MAAEHRQLETLDLGQRLRNSLACVAQSSRPSGMGTPTRGLLRIARASERVREEQRIEGQQWRGHLLMISVGLSRSRALLRKRSQVRAIRRVRWRRGSAGTFVRPPAGACEMSTSQESWPVRGVASSSYEPSTASPELPRRRLGEPTSPRRRLLLRRRPRFGAQQQQARDRRDWAKERISLARSSRCAASDLEGQRKSGEQAKSLERKRTSRLEATVRSFLPLRSIALYASLARSQPPPGSYATAAARSPARSLARARWDLVRGRAKEPRTPGSQPPVDSGPGCGGASSMSSLPPPLALLKAHLLS